MTPSSVRSGLATQLDTLTGLRVFDYIPDQAPTPCAVVGNLTIEFDEAFGRGLDMGTVDCLVIVSRMNDRGAQDKLDAYLAGSGAGSVKTAIEADKTLSGSVATSRVTRATPIEVDISGIKYFAYRYEVEVYG
jgi:hypothetical protein